MPKATKSSAQGANQAHPPEELIQSSQEELSSSDQEPDQEVSFQHIGSSNQFQACSCPTFTAPKWIGLLMMGLS